MSGEHASQMTADPAALAQGQQRALTLPRSVIIGWLLITLYFISQELLPTSGPSEFAYLPFEPEFQLFSAMRGFTVEQLVNHVLRVSLLGPGLWLSSLGLARVLLQQPTRLPRIPARLHVWAGALSIATTAFVMLYVLRGRPTIDDEVTYAAMARTFARGLLAEPAYRGQVLDLFEVLTQVGVTGKYLFGEALVQMAGTALGVPALAHLLINSMTLAALYQSVKLLCDDRALASCSCALLAISPTFMLCAATGQSEPTSLCCLALAILGYAIASKRSPLWGGLLSGAAVGLGMWVRIQALLPAGFVLGCALLGLSVRTRRPWASLGFAGSLLPCAAVVGAYNHALTGSALVLPWFLQHETAEHYGFVQVWAQRDFVHTPLGALQNLLVVAVRMNAWWLGWPLSLLILTRLTAVRRVMSEAAIFMWVSAALVLFELGYYSPGASDVGPIYHFELLLCLSVLGAAFLLQLWRERPHLALAGVLVHVLLGTGSFVWEQSARLGRLAEVIHQEPEQVLRMTPAGSLLLYDIGCDAPLRLGWMHRPFAQVNHDPRAPVVSYARPRPHDLDTFLSHFPGRTCFYLDRDEDREPRVAACSDVRERLLQPWPDEQSRQDCPQVPSTARLLGLSP